MHMNLISDSANV